MAHVFISYVHQNRDVVDRLAKELRNSGVTVWLDRNDIEPGARWRDAISKAIKSGGFFIACFSREYNERKKTHMNEELTLAIEELRAMPPEQIWFIPILINETYIPSRRISSVEQLSDIHPVKLYEDWNVGFNRILSILGYSDQRLARIWRLIDMVNGPFDKERLHAIRELGEQLSLIRVAHKMGAVRAAHELEIQLGTIEAVEKPALFTLIKATKSNDSEIKLASLEALAEIGPDAAEAVPTLLAALKDPGRNVRRRAARALAEIGPDAVPTLVAALKDPDEDVRALAAYALAEIGPDAAEAVPTLLAALKDPDERVRQNVADALASLQHKQSK